MAHQEIPPENGSETQPKEKRPDPVLEELTRKYERFIDANRAKYQRYAGDSSLEFVPKLGQGFYIDNKTGKITFDPTFYEGKFPAEQTEAWVDWSLYHEGTHGIEFRDNPEDILNNFKYIGVKSKEVAEKIVEIWKKRSGGKLPAHLEKTAPVETGENEDGTPIFETLTRAEHLARGIARKALATDLYNIFDDVSVNTKIRNRTGRFAKNSEGDKEIVQPLYKERLFKNTDYKTPEKDAEGKETNFPLHLQLVYPYLREQMVPDEPTQVSDEVKNIRENLSYFGKKFGSIQEFNNEMILKGTPAERYARIRKCFEPEFIQLFLKDMETRGLPPPSDGGGNREGGEGGEGNGTYDPFEAEHRPMKEFSPDQIPEKDRKKFLKKKKAEKDKKGKEKADSLRPSGDVKNEHDMDREKKWCDEHGVDFEKLKAIKKIEKKVAPYLAEMSKFWQQIVYGESVEREISWDKFYKTGPRMNINRVISKWPEIENGNLENVKVMEKRVTNERRIQKPETIRIRLAVDRSGTMNEERIRMVKQLAVLLGRSLGEFNNHLAATRETTKSKLISDLQIIGFDSAPEELKPLAGDDFETRDYDQDEANFINGVGEIKTTGGTTADFLALEFVEKSLTDEDKKRMANGNLLEIVIEVTDGGSDNADETKKQKDKLKQAGTVSENADEKNIGMTVKAFQIGNPDETEIAKFKIAWQNDGDGEQVPELADLLPVTANLLQDILGDVKV